MTGGDAISSIGSCLA